MLSPLIEVFFSKLLILYLFCQKQNQGTELTHYRIHPGNESVLSLPLHKVLLHCYLFCFPYQKIGKNEAEF